MPITQYDKKGGADDKVIRGATDDTLIGTDLDTASPRTIKEFLDSLDG